MHALADLAQAALASVDVGVGVLQAHASRTLNPCPQQQPHPLKQNATTLTPLQHNTTTASQQPTLSDDLSSLILFLRSLARFCASFSFDSNCGAG